MGARIRRAMVVVFIVSGWQAARAQVARDSTSRHGYGLTLAGPADDQYRGEQLLGTRSTAGYLLRSPSSIRALLEPAQRNAALRVLGPDLLVVHNSALPYSYNDGALWAGRGMNVSATAGVEYRGPRVRVVVAPELTWSENQEYRLAEPESHAPIPANRSPFSAPFHSRGNSIDLPIRFGPEPLRRIGPGQSAILVDAGAFTAGASTENEWWGPGVLSSLLLSNNAAGFPHAVIGTRRPLRSRAGQVELRWLAGGLRTSDFFTTDSTNGLRSIAMLGVTYRPAVDSNLTLGAARAVYRGVGTWGAIAGSALDVLANVGQPNAKPPGDTTQTPGKDQLLSLFFRWVLPNDHFEAYGEWGRAEFPVSLRDFLEQPNHSEAYLAGLQWIGDEGWKRGRARVHGEVEFLQKGTSYRFRPLGSWYTSRAVAAGYTNEGQVLGAAIGPGGSRQSLSVDYVLPAWQVGASVTRIRWMEDVHAQCVYAPELSLYGFTDHDVSFLTGLRGVLRTAVGTFAASVDPGWRLNVFFPRCGRSRYPLPEPRDERNRTITLRFSPRL